MRSNAALAYSHRAPRWTCDFDAVITDESGRDLACRIGNISEGGFMADCEEEIAADSVIQATLPGRGLVRAEIRWTIGTRFGAMILDD